MASNLSFSISSILADEPSSNIKHFENIKTFLEYDNPQDVNMNAEEVEEQEDPERPQYTYTAMITMAIRNSPEYRLTLNEIYDYILDKFPYFRNCKTQWKNSVRHNLSVSKIFMKYPRKHGDQGRGNYWTLSPEADETYIGEDTGKLRFMNVPPMPQSYPMLRQPMMVPTNMPSSHNLLMQQLQQHQQIQHQQQLQQLQQHQIQQHYLMAQSNLAQHQFYGGMQANGAPSAQIPGCCSHQARGGVGGCSCCTNFNLQMTQMAGNGFRYRCNV